MHELSIAQALLDQIEHHVPAAATLSCARVRAGAMQAIEPDAMQWAWRAATDGGRFDGATLELTIEPFTLLCPACQRRWASDDLFEPCTCGHPRPQSVGDDGLTLMSLDIIEQADAQQDCQTNTRA